MPPKNQPDLTILPDDKEFVDRIAGIIPLEASDRDSLITLIAAHRMMHATASPAADHERRLSLEVLKNQHAMRVIHWLVTQLGGSAEVKEDDIPFNWELSLEPVKDARVLKIIAGRAPPPKANEQAVSPAS